VLASPRTRSPIEPMDEHTRRGLLDLARRKEILAATWAG